jgi:hypothetical protein
MVVESAVCAGEHGAEGSLARSSAAHEDAAMRYTLARPIPSFAAISDGPSP